MEYRLTQVLSKPRLKIEGALFYITLANDTTAVFFNTGGVFASNDAETANQYTPGSHLEFFEESEFDSLLAKTHSGRYVRMGSPNLIDQEFTASAVYETLNDFYVRDTLTGTDIYFAIVQAPLSVYDIDVTFTLDKPYIVIGEATQAAYPSGLDFVAVTNNFKDILNCLNKFDVSEFLRQPSTVLSNLTEPAILIAVEQNK